MRRIRFHEPETLSLDEYCFTYLYEPTAILAGVLTTRDAAQLFQRHLSAFSPGDRVIVETTADPGVLSCANVRGEQSFGLLATGDPSLDRQRIPVTFTDTGFEVPMEPIQPGEFDVGPVSLAGTFYPIRPGPVIIEFEQRSRVASTLSVIFFPVFGMTAPYSDARRR